MHGPSQRGPRDFQVRTKATVIQAGRSGLARSDQVASFESFARGYKAIAQTGQIKIQPSEINGNDSRESGAIRMAII